MRTLLIAIFIFFSFFSCAPQASDKDLVLARYQSGQITAHELSQHLAQSPGIQSSSLSDTQSKKWLIDKLNELFQIKRLVNEDELLFLKTNAGFQQQLQRSTQKMLADAYLNQVLPAFTVPEEDIQAFLATNSPPSNPERRALQNIFLRFPPNAEKTDKAATKRQAEDLRKQILAGASFDQLAREFSDSSTASRGGAFGYAGRNDLRASLAQAVFALKVGELSEVLVEEDGCHLFFLKHIVGDAPEILQKRFEQAKQQLLNTKKQAWAKSHLQECLIKKNLSLPGWPQEPADQTGIIFSMNDQRITEPEMMLAAPNRATLREVFLMRMGELVFANELAATQPELAEVTRNFAERMQAYLYLRRKAILDQIKKLPEQERRLHYENNPDHFKTTEKLAVHWFGFPVDPADPSASVKATQAFAAQLQTSGEAKKPPTLNEKIELMSRRDFRFAHPELDARLPQQLSQGMVLQPFRLGELFLVLQITEHQPAQIVPFEQLLDQVSLDYFRVHSERLVEAWIKQSQASQNYELQEEALQRFMETWQKTTLAPEL